MKADEKKWYFRENQQNQGPFSLAEIQSKAKDGIITPKTHVWYNGMEKWLKAGQVNELKGVFEEGPPTPPVRTISDASTFTHKPAAFEQAHAAIDENSILMELRPREVDDRTGVFDSKNLRRAKKEAARAEKVSQKAQRKYQSKLSRKRPLTTLMIATVVGGAGYLLTEQGILSPKQITAFVSTWTDRVMSPLPTLEDVTSEDYILLKRTAEASLSKSGPQVYAVTSTKNITRPLFIFATNLPDGVNFTFYLHGEPHTLLSNKSIDLQFPFSILHKMALSKAIQTIEGSDLPIGEYQGVITEEDDQPPHIKNILDGLSPFSGSTPPYVPAGRKIILIQKFFLGGNKDTDYLSKLNSLHEKTKQHSTQELHHLKNWGNQAESTLNQIEAEEKKIAKISSQITKKKLWSTFEMKLQVPPLNIQEKDVHHLNLFKNTQELTQNFQRLFKINRSCFMNAPIIIEPKSPFPDPSSSPQEAKQSMSPSLESSNKTATAADITREITEMRQKFDAFKKALDEAQKSDREN